MGAQQPGQQPQVPPQGGKAGGGQAPTTPGQVPPQGGKAQQPGQPGQAAIPSWAQPFVQKLGPGQPPSQQPMDEAKMRALGLPPQLTGYPPVQPGQPQLPPQGGKGIGNQPIPAPVPPQVKGLPPVQTIPRPAPAPAPVPVKKAAPAPVAAKKVVVPPQKAGLAALGIMGRR